MLNVIQSTRMNSNKWTKAFCLLAAVHCALQIGLQFGAYANNRATSSAFDSVVSNMTLTPRPFAILEKNGDLTLCTDIPQRFGGPDACIRRSFKSGSTNTVKARFSVDFDPEDNQFELIGLDESDPTEDADVPAQCLETFPWVFDVSVAYLITQLSASNMRPFSSIHDATREDLVFVLFQGWLLGISLAAVCPFYVSVTTY